MHTIRIISKQKPDEIEMTKNREKKGNGIGIGQEKEDKAIKSGVISQKGWNGKEKAEWFCARMIRGLSKCLID